MKRKPGTINTLLSSLLVAGALLISAQADASQQLAPRPDILSVMLAPQLDGKLNVNAADTKQWELLPGIGPATAKKLVDYRAKRKFGDLTHVMRIKGIGRKTYGAIKPFLTLDGETTLHVVKNK
jgi:DNA uptake protein ComE-like DNA-binding protein